MTTTTNAPTAAPPKAGRPRTVKPPVGVPLVGYSMRNMRQDYLDRLRLLAVYERTSLEMQVVRALGKGLPVLEQERRARRAASAQP